MDIEKINDYIEAEWNKAERSTDPEARKKFLASANEAQKLKNSLQKEESEPMATDGSWLTREHTTKFTWWQVLAGIATPLATLGAAIFTFAGVKKQSDSLVECKRLELESKERMLKDIVRGSEYDTPDTMAIRTLNELNK